MKKFLLAIILVFPTLLFSQIFNPVEWEFSQEDIGGGEYELVFKASIEDGWYLYSQFVEDDGPLPTTFTFFESNSYELIGTTQEGEPKQEYDPNFDMVLSYFTNEAVFSQKVKAVSTDSKVDGELMFMVCDATQCLPPEYVDFSFTLGVPSEQVETKGVDDAESTSSLNLVASDSQEPAEKKSNKKGMWSIFFIAFLSGFAALLTPCVFPMIPMTVSYFTKQSENKAKGVTNAIIYGISIIVIYVALGVGVSALFGPEVLNSMATNAYFNIAFFVLLVVFAASFLGAFELTLPSSWINKADRASDRGGLVGIFFMALVLALVSFSCTGPIVGTLLVEAASGGSYMGPIIGMLGFSLAIALPFALFAAFPGWLNSLPQSGGWLNSVKVVLGFLELALAFKFLSNADLVWQTHLLEREVFIAIWIIIFAFLTMYLLGMYKLSHDSDLKYVSVGRLFMAILTGMFTVYMIPGLWGAPLKIINAFPPPMHYSESPHGVGFTKGGSIVAHSEEEGQHLGPQGIMVFHDYDEGMAHAKKVGLPAMIDFTGWACVNCRKMEEQVWSDSEVKRILSEDVVLISLYVDERTPLDEDKQYETTIAGKKKKVRTVGDKWTVLQAETYKTNSQPYYVILDHNENQMGVSANYQDYGEVDLFKTWLQEGIDEFNQ
ncbi:MAG: cytochrome c biogenesis protein CcdA [Flavobacteriales bacterium]|jgi:thiol:disulfide interchange protein DsbD|nr:cytochrome c biogenesis protein CcdA [Flavobacteriales bacterium]